MTEPTSAPRSRRALLAAAAGGAAALAASAALPLTAVAHDAQDVQKNVDNPTTATTTVTNATAASPAFAGSATGTGYGLQGTSGGGAGVFAWSVAPPNGWDPAFGAYVGVFGSAPVSPDPTSGAAGVWGDSDDFGVYGSGSIGVFGIGDLGVYAESTSANAAVLAVANTAVDTALDVRGKVKFSRSGRSTIGAGKSSILVTLAGVTSVSRVFAVLHSNRSNRWVRAVVPVTGKFTIYLNASATSATYVAWFVIN
jgi:hypothetical protein